jgi:catechol 2,3-dioxygenase-like lactoylglutathione lyase family enzyme
MSNPNTALGRIRGLDYTVIRTRDMAAMRRFYETVMHFPLERELGPGWIEYRIGSSILALAQSPMMENDPPVPTGAASLQLAFRVAPSDVSRCEDELRAAGIAITSSATDQSWAHRTLFFRDPDGNVLEIYAEI